MKNWQKLSLTISVAVLALLLEFGFKKPLFTQGLVTVVGAILALSMLIEMVKTLRSGRYGVDLLAIIAIISTLIIGQYWASLIIILMLVGGVYGETHGLAVTQNGGSFNDLSLAAGSFQSSEGAGEKAIFGNGVGGIGAGDQVGQGECSFREILLGVYHGGILSVVLDFDLIHSMRKESRLCRGNGGIT